VYNAAVLVGPDGVVLQYRKLHLLADEIHVFARGDRGLPVVVMRHGTIGLCVCYDLRFVETLRILAPSGAALVCVPTAWVAGFDKSHWDAEGCCPQARVALMQANLNQVFIACASQAGTHAGPWALPWWDDPYGQCVAGPLAGDRDDVVVEVDLRKVAAARDRGNGVRPREDRRTDLYRLEVEGRRL
jgi:N-carbamoylputrescine amidase